MYGEAFALVGVASSADERRKTLSDSISLFGDGLLLQAEQLIARDESDSNNREFGQNVRDTYSMSDVFVPSDAGMDVSGDIDRYVDSIFGFPFLTPRPGEERHVVCPGRCLAFRRSRAPSRCRSHSKDGISRRCWHERSTQAWRWTVLGR